MKTNLKITIAAMLLLLSCSNEKENTETYVKQGYDEGYEQGFKDGFEYGYAEGLKNGGNEPEYANIMVIYNELIKDNAYDRYVAYRFNLLDEEGVDINGTYKELNSLSDIKVSDTLDQRWKILTAYGFGEQSCVNFSILPSDSMVITQGNYSYYKRNGKIFYLPYVDICGLSESYVLNTFGNRKITRYIEEEIERDLTYQQFVSRLEGLTVIYFHIDRFESYDKFNFYTVYVIGIKGNSIKRTMYYKEE